MQVATNNLIYKRVENDLIKLIERGHFKTGDKLPSDRLLAERFSVNHRTVRRALEGFVKAGLIERQIGSGTFLRASFPEIKKVLKEGETKDVADAGSARKKIGMVVSNNKNPYSLELIEHFQKYARDIDIDFKISIVSENPDEFYSAVADFTEQQCDAIIFLSRPEQGESTVYDICSKSTIPIALSYRLPGMESHYFEKDVIYGQSEFLNMSLGVKYLNELGYTNIAYWGPDNPEDIIASRRLFTYIRNIEKVGKSVAIGLSDLEFSRIETVLDSWKPFIGELAVMCYDDVWAQRLITTAYRHGYSVPDDIAVVGINNIASSKHSDPPLTSFSYDYDYISHGLMNFAINLADGKEKRDNPAIKEQLVIRDSCGGKKLGRDKLVRLLEDIKVEMKNDYREIEFSIE